MRKRIPQADRRVLYRLLYEVRREAGMRQVQMAKRLGKPQSFVSKYESGEQQLNMLEVERICRAAGLTLTIFSRRLEKAIGK